MSSYNKCVVESSASVGRRLVATEDVAAGFVFLREVPAIALPARDEEATSVLQRHGGSRAAATPFGVGVAFGGCYPFFPDATPVGSLASSKQCADALVMRAIQRDPVLSATLCDTVTAACPSTVSREARQLYSNAFCHTRTADGGERRFDIVALYRCLSVVNHSCWPNAVAVSVERPWPTDDEGEETEATILETSLIAVAAISKGEEIFISYRELYAPTSQRRLYLQHRYGFRCSCAWCAACDADVAAVGEAERLSGRCCRCDLPMVAEEATTTEAEGPLAAALLRRRATLMRHVLPADEDVQRILWNEASVPQERAEAAAALLACFPPHHWIRIALATSLTSALSNVDQYGKREAARALEAVLQQNLAPVAGGPSCRAFWHLLH